MADVKISGLPAATTPLAGTEVLPIVQSTTTKKVSIADVTAGRAVSASSLTATNFKTSPATANLDISGTTIAASGSDANVDVNINAKGSGVAYLNQRWGVNQSGALVASAGNTYDIGNGTNNPRDVNVDRYVYVKDNVIIATSGKGIDFSATPGTGTSELFDDYEEGTWTPSLVSDGGSITNATNYGFYTKIGRQVTLTISATASSVGSPSGDLYIFTLPFALDTATGATSAISVTPYTLEATATTMICGTVISNYILLRRFDAGVNTSLAASMKAGSSFNVTATYFTAS